jgi:hypothetical protein
MTWIFSTGENADLNFVSWLPQNGKGYDCPDKKQLNP